MPFDARRLAAVPMLLVVSCWSLVGCDGTEQPADEAQVRLASATRPPSEGAWAECRLAEGDESGWARTVCPEPKADGTERDCSGSYVSEREDDGSMECEVTALCNYECETDADCPQPQSGSVVPVCHSVCRLPCRETSECPDGMTCHHQDHGDTSDAQGMCRYVYLCE